MRRTILTISLFVFAAILTSSAYAQSSTGSATVTSATSGHGRGIGLGAVTMLNGTSGALFTWGSRGGGFHVDGLFGLHHYRDGNGNYTTAFGLGGRFWYHVHAASFADFSLGGGLGITHWTSNPGDPNEDGHLDLSLEVGAQIRAFIVPNVALIGDLGLGATFGSNDDILIGGHGLGGAGEPEGPGFMFGTLGIAYFFE